MSYWSKLSMKDKADVMKLFLDRGISDLDTMRREYNIFAEGGDTNYSYTKPLNNVFLDDEGNLLDPEVPSAKGTIRTPEVVIATRDPRKAVPTANGLNIPDVSSELKRRFYDHITPAGYEFPITRTVAAALNPGRVKTIEVNPQTRRGKTIYPGLITALRDDLFAEYLQIPKEERHKVIINAENSAYNSGELEETSLRPTNAENDKYFKFKNLSKLEKDRLVKLGTPLSVGSNTLSGALRAYLGEHTIGHGHDTKGDYVSYYDNWDLAPFTGKGEDQSLGIGKPVHIYDRIYLDDYFGIPEEYRGSTYIPELTVTANKHADGGGIHIDPSKRGTFKAQASKMGMGVQEAASHILANKENYSPAMVKKANFARNASKWHGLGGLLEI